MTLFVIEWEQFRKELAKGSLSGVLFVKITKKENGRNVFEFYITSGSSLVKSTYIANNLIDSLDFENKIMSDLNDNTVRIVEAFGADIHTVSKKEKKEFEENQTPSEMVEETDAEDDMSNILSQMGEANDNDG